MAFLYNLNVVYHWDAYKIMAIIYIVVICFFKSVEILLMIIEDSHLVGEKYLMMIDIKEAIVLMYLNLRTKRSLFSIWRDLWTDTLLNQLEKISNEVEFILWPLYIDYEKEVLKSLVKEYKNQLSKLQCKVLMINSYSNNLNEAGCTVNTLVENSYSYTVKSYSIGVFVT